MTDIGEKLKLPEPLKVKPSIARYLDKLEDEGKTIWAFEGSNIIENLFYLHLMNKYTKGNKKTNWYRYSIKSKIYKRRRTRIKSSI